MSGFAGIVRADGGAPDAKLLERMAERLTFRGPDATQIWTRPGAGFSFTLLRTGPSAQAARALPPQGCITKRRPATQDGRNMAAIGHDSVDAISLKPSGISVTLSPWLIQTLSMPWPSGVWKSWIPSSRVV